MTRNASVTMTRCAYAPSQTNILCVIIIIFLLWFVTDYGWRRDDVIDCEKTWWRSAKTDIRTFFLFFSIKTPCFRKRPVTDLSLRSNTFRNGCTQHAQQIHEKRHGFCRNGTVWTIVWRYGTGENDRNFVIIAVRRKSISVACFQYLNTTQS